MLAKHIRTVIASCLLTFSVTQAVSAQERPNVLLIFLDNFGWGEPGFNGGGIIRGAATPELDQLAAEGLRLTNFNVEVQCTPSRSAIMTGRYAIHEPCIGERAVLSGGGVDDDLACAHGASEIEAAELAKVTGMSAERDEAAVGYMQAKVQLPPEAAVRRRRSEWQKGAQCGPWTAQG